MVVSGILFGIMTPIKVCVGWVGGGVGPHLGDTELLFNLPVGEMRQMVIDVVDFNIDLGGNALRWLVFVCGCHSHHHHVTGDLSVNHSDLLQPAG